MNIISGILFCVFGIVYIGKLIVLRTKKINANSLGKKGKLKEIYTTEVRVKIFTFINNTRRKTFKRTFWRCLSTIFK